MIIPWRRPRRVRGQAPFLLLPSSSSFPSLLRRRFSRCRDKRGVRQKTTELNRLQENGMGLPRPCERGTRGDGTITRPAGTPSPIPVLHCPHTVCDTLRRTFHHFFPARPPHGRCRPLPSSSPIPFGFLDVRGSRRRQCSPCTFCIHHLCQAV